MWSRTSGNEPNLAALRGGAAGPVHAWSEMGRVGPKRIMPGDEAEEPGRARLRAGGAEPV